MAQTVFEEITIGNETIRLEHRDIPLENIELDDDNPRLRYFRKKDDTQTLEQFLKNLSDAPKLRKAVIFVYTMRSNRATAQIRRRKEFAPIRKGAAKVAAAKKRRLTAKARKPKI